jgi:release factor glutamine methyltransferase
MAEKKLKTLLEILDYSSELLERENVSDARLNVELMLADVLKCNRVRLYMDFDKPLAKEEISSFKVLLKRRLNKEPLQYILGKTCFYGYDFMVNKNVFIPRPETEMLVEKILEDIRDSGVKHVKIFEIGTGSGCISVSLSKELSKMGVGHSITSIDNSREALDVAYGNKNLNNVDESNVRFKEEDIFDVKFIEVKFDYIVSNPPYIPKEDFDKLDEEIKNYEPRPALSDNGDGLTYFKKIFVLLKTISFNTKAFFEIGYDQKEVLELSLKEMNLEDFTFFEDYNKIYRILKINI